ncbi:hypothetical protein ABW21_db0203182 [Orbilia brochopaga]|nr:hypothetical protein ABW21_db0203182 [Drechslerella brochopaga]
MCIDGHVDIRSHTTRYFCHTHADIYVLSLIAAASVAGLLAYYIGLGFTTTEARVLLLGFAYTLDKRISIENAPSLGINLINNNAWGLCKGARNNDSPWCPLEGSATESSAHRARFLEAAKARALIRRRKYGIDANYDGLVLWAPDRGLNGGDLTTEENTSTPTEQPSSVEEDEPSPVEDEPGAETLTVEDEPVVGELITLGDSLLYIIPPLVIGGIIAIVVPLANGKKSTTHVNVTEYASTTISLGNASNLNITIPTILIPSIPISVSATTTITGPPITSAPPSRSSLSAITGSATTTKVPGSHTSTSIELPPADTLLDGVPSPSDKPTAEDAAKAPSDKQYCHGLFKAKDTPARWVQYLTGNWYYVHRDTMAKLISDDVCEDLQPDHAHPQGHVEKTFFHGSPEMVTFYYEWRTVPPYKEECKANFLKVLDGCDGNDPLNPYNWKGGGERVVGNNLYFKIEPKWSYRKIPDKKFAACWFRSRWNSEALGTIWGYGWNDAFDDWLVKPDGTKSRKGRGPEDFFNEVMGCGWDGRWQYIARTPEPREKAQWEWKINIGFETSWLVDPRGRLSQRCLEDAVKKFSGIQDFKCGSKNLEPN